MDREPLAEDTWEERGLSTRDDGGNVAVFVPNMPIEL